MSAYPFLRMDRETKAIRSRDRASEIMISGSIWRAVWYIAWPTAINTIIQTAYMNINPMFLGHLGKNAEIALAATSIGRTVLMVQFSVLFGISVGAGALVSRFLGAEVYDDADEAARQSMWLSIVVGIVTMLPLIFYAEPLVKLMGAEGSVVPTAARYVAIISYSSIPAFLSMIIVSVLRSAGDVMRPLYAGVITTGLVAILDYVFIFGVGPIPRMEVVGSAISTNIARFLGMLLMIWFLKASVLRGSLDHFRPHFGWFKRIMRVGIPAAVQNLLFTTSGAGFMMVIGRVPNPSAAQAALGVGMALESLAFMPGSAYAMAAAPLVGQNLGAGQPDRAERSAWAAAWQSAALMGLIAVWFLVIPERLAGIFFGGDSVVSSAAVVPLVVTYLRLNAISEPFLAIGMTIRGALQGAGDVIVPTFITFLTLWVIRLPLAWLLAVVLGYGATGAWIAMSVSTILSGLLAVAWFKTGNWRGVEV